MAIKLEKHHDYTNKIINNNGGLFNEDEIEVGNILLDLPYLVTKSLASYRFPYNWNIKKPRSALLLPPSPLTHSSVIVKDEEASSPTTPLSFSPSESDSKFKLSSSSFKRKPPGLNLRREELEKTVRNKLTTQQQLQEALAKVKEHWNILMAENSELKAKKQKLLMMNFGEKREKIMTTCTTQTQHQQTTTVNDLVHAVPSTSTEFHHQLPLIIPNQLVNDLLYASPSNNTQFLHHGPLINGQQVVVMSDPVGAGPSTSTQFRHPSPSIPHRQYAFYINQEHQHDLVSRRQNYQIDLNMSPEEDYMRVSQMNKAIAAAARKNRIQANKEKKTRVK